MIFNLNNSRIRAVKFASLLAIMLLVISNAQAQLTGTIAVPSANYPTVKSMVDSLNLQGVGSGGVTFNVAAGLTEVAPSGGYILTATGTAANPIVIQKSGAGANPQLMAHSTGTALASATTTQDGIFRLVGSDWVTIDGINLLDTNTLANTMMEYGYGMFKVNGTNGCNSNTIKNCTISLSRGNFVAGNSETTAGSVGILSVNTTAVAPATPLTVSSAAGTNSNNKIYANTITNCNVCIFFRGYTDPGAPYSFYDQNNDIGGGSGATGNSCLNFGGGAGATTTAAGILVSNQNAVNVSYNNINNNNGSGINHIAEIKGILSSSPNAALVNLNNNTVSIKIGANSSFFTYQMIDVSGGSVLANSVINMNNNTVANCVMNPMTNANNTNSLTALRVTSTTAPTVNIMNNQVYEDSMLNVGGFTGINYSNSNVNAIGTISGNEIRNIVKIINNGTSGGQNLTGIATSSGGAIVQNNLIHDFTTSNITGTMATQTAAIIINSSSFSNSLIIDNNDIYNLVINTNTTSTPSNGTIFGILNTNTGTANANLQISNNKIHDCTANNTNTGSGQMVGIVVTDGNVGCNVFRNKIYNLNSVGSALTTVGLRVTSALSVNVHNNYIGHLGATTSNGNEQVIGINDITSTTTPVQVHNYYHNTVYLTATSSGVNFGTTAIRTTFTAPSGTSLAPNITLRNNIFINNSTPNGTGLTVVHRRNVPTSISNYTTASNNNLFYAGTPGPTRLIYYDGTNSDQTLAAYKARVPGREQASVTENTSFLSLTGSSSNYLHVNASVSTQTESGGANIAGMSTDYDNDIRANFGGYIGTGTNPDIGADEFNGIISDLAPPTVIAGTILGACGNGDRTITGVVISDATGVPTTGGLVPRIYFKRNYNGTYASSAGTLSTGSGTYGTWDFTIPAASLPGLATNDSVYYYFLAQDVVGSPNIGSQPSGAVATDVNTVSTDPSNAAIISASSFYRVLVSLSGPYDVGTGSPFATTLTQAINIYNNACISGPVTFNLTNSTYVTGEVFPDTIRANPYASATNTLTIKPKTGNVSIPASSAATSAVVLFGADWIIIDGSVSPVTNTVCPLVTSTRNLTISVSNTNPTGVCPVFLASIGNDGATNNIIRNCILVGNSNTTTTCGIGSAGSGGIGTGTNNTGFGNNNNTFENDSILKCVYGIVSAGSSGLIKNQNNVYRLNKINSTGANAIGRGGMILGFENNALVTGNTIGNIVGASSGADAFGISIGASNSFTASGGSANECSNITVTKNTIDSIQTFATPAAQSAVGIIIGNQVSGVPSSGAIHIANNMISRVSSNANNSGSFADFACGIFVGYNLGATNQIYNNTINMNARNYTTSASPNVGIYAISSGSAPVYSGTHASIDMKNNIITSTGSNGSGNNFGVVLQAALATGNYPNYLADYNDIFVASGGGSFNAVGAIGPATSIVYALNTLADWKIETGRDANSISTLPAFVANNNPHLLNYSASNFPLNGTATVLASVTDDIDCEARTGSLSPDIGADEFTLPPIDLAFDAIKPTANGSCHGVSEPVIVTIRNTGSTPINLATDSVSVTVIVSGVISATVTGVANTGILASNDTLSIVCTPTINTSANGSYTFATTLSTIAGESITANNSNATTININNVAVSVVAAAQYFSLCSGQSSNVTATPSNGTVPYTYSWSTGATTATTSVSPSSTTTYTVTVTDFCGVTTSATASIILNNPQIATTTGDSICGSGNAMLSATLVDTLGANTYWYNSPTALPPPVSIGTSYTTPLITSTTTYYVSAISGSGPYTTGLTNNSFLNGSYSLAAGNNLQAASIRARKPGYISGFTVYPFAAGQATFAITLHAPPFTQLVVSPVYTFTAAQVGTPVRINCNLPIPVVDSSYQINWYPAGSSTTGNMGFGKYNSYTAGGYPFTTSDGSFQLVGNGNILNTNISTGLYPSYFNIEYTTVCESPRTPVVAQVITPPLLDITPNKSLCQGTVYPIEVTSPLSNYTSYTWTPIANLWLDSAMTIPYTAGLDTSKVYIFRSVASSNQVICNANDSINGCATSDTTTITYFPTTTGIITSNTSLCGSGTVTLSLIPSTGYAAGSVVWQSSPDSITWTTYATGNGTNQPPVFSSTSYFRALLVSATGDTCGMQAVKVTVYAPSIITTIPGTRCGTGTVNLGVTVSPGATAAWYSSPSSQPALAIDTVFTTPSISSTTTYYVSAYEGSTVQPVGVPAALPLYGSVFSGNLIGGPVTPDKPLWITFNKPGIIKEITYYPTAVGTLTFNVRLRGTTIDSIVSAPITVTAADTGTQMIIPLNMIVPFVGNYQITNLGVPGKIMAPYNGGAGPYPFSTANGAMTIVGSANNSTSVSAPTANYNAMFNIKYETACESARQPIVATVLTPPVFTLNTNIDTACGTSPVMLAVTSNHADYQMYTWAPIAGLYKDAGATIPYNSGDTATTVYALPLANTVYTATASDSILGCVSTQNASITPIYLISGGTTSSNVTDVCSGNNAILTVSNVFNLTIAGRLWEISPDSINWSPIPAATGTVYLAAGLINTTYFRCGIYCKGGLTGYSPVIKINVFNPQILSTTPGQRCGPGSVTLQATADSSSVIQWYASPTGLPIDTGVTFNTPVIGSTTTFYAAAKSGVYFESAGLINPNTGGGAVGVNDRGIQFNATKPFTLLTTTIREFSGGSGTIDIALQNSSGVELQSTGPQAYGPGATVMLLNFSVPTGNGYRLVCKGGSNPTLNIQTSGFTYPLNSTSGAMSITGSITTGVVSTNIYYFFFDNVISTSCYSALVPVVATVNPVTAVNVAVSDSVLCPGDSTTLTATSTNDPFYSYVWSNGTTGNTITVAPSVTTSYTITATDISGGPSNGCQALVTKTIEVHPPVPVSSFGPTTTAICAGDSVSIAATITPSSGDAVIGTSTLNANGFGNFPAPYGNSYESVKHQMLIRASELAAAGLTNGSELNSLSFDVPILGTSGIHKAFTIRLAKTADSIVAGWATSGFSTVFGPLDYQPVTGVNTHAFSGAFVWDGYSNIIVETCFSNDPTNAGTFTTVNAIMNRTPTSFNSVIYANLNDLDICPLIPGFALSVNRPNMVFNYSKTLSYAWSPATGLSVTNQPAVMASPGASTTYTLTVTTLQGCSQAYTSAVTVSQQLYPVITPGDSVACVGDVVNYYVYATDTGAYAGGYPPGTTFDWNDLNGPVADKDSAIVGPAELLNGLVSVTVTLPPAFGGCIGKSDTITLNFQEPHTQVFMSQVEVDGCNPMTGCAVAENINGNAPFRYIWVNALGDTIRNVVDSTFYTGPYDTDGDLVLDDFDVDSIPDLYTIYTDSACGLGIGTYTVYVNTNATSNYPPPSCQATGSVSVSRSACANISDPCVCVDNIDAGTRTNPSDGQFYETVSILGGTTPWTLVSLTTSSGRPVSASAAPVCTGDNTTETTAVTTANIVTHIPNDSSSLAFYFFDGDTYTLTIIDAMGDTLVFSGGGCMYPAQPVADQVISACVADTAANVHDLVFPTAPTGITVQWYNDTTCSASPLTYAQLGSMATNYPDIYNAGNPGPNGMGYTAYTLYVSSDSTGDAACEGTRAKITLYTSNVALTETHDTIACFGASTGSIDITITDGTAPFTFAWSSGATTEDVTGLAAGTYTVTVTDSLGCTATTSVTVTQNALITASFTITPNLCNGDANANILVAPAGGMAPYTYLWSNGQTTATATGLMAGTLMVTITDSVGCSFSDSAVVVDPTVVTATCTGTNVLCNAGNDGTASVAAGGGTPGYTYLWSTTSTNASVSGLTAGTYTVTVTDANGCTATCEYTVTEPAVLTVTLTPANVTCLGGSDGSIAAAPSGGTMAYSYLWNNGQTNATATGLTSGTYTVTVTDANGCAVTASETITHNFVIPAMPGAITGPTLVCRNTTQSYSIAAVPGTTTYTWTAPAGATVNSGQGTTNVTIFFSNTSVTGNVSVTAGNVCGNSAPRSALVTVVPNKPAMPTITGLQNGVCGRKNLVYTCSVVAGATSYTWTVPTGATLASGQGTNSILVHFGNAFTGSGFITVTANNICGSSNVRSYFVGGKLPTPAISGLNWTCPDSLRTYTIAPITGATSYTWTVVPGSTLLSGQGTTSITVKWGYINGVIKVKANSVSVCAGSNTAQKPVSFTCVREGNELFSGLGIYPNPTDNLTVVDFDAFETSEGTIQVFNMLGAMVYNKAISVAEGRNRVELNVQHFAPGAYLIRVSAKGFSRVERLVVE